MLPDSSGRIVDASTLGTLTRLQSRLPSSHPRTAPESAASTFSGSGGDSSAREYLSLLAIGQAHRRAELVLRDVLEFLQVLAGVRRVAGLLVGARQSELCRSVQRIDLECVLEGVDGLRKLFEPAT